MRERRNTLTILAVVSIAAILAVSIFLTYGVNREGSITYIQKRVLTPTSEENGILQEASAAPECGETISGVRSKASFPVLTPTTMVSGYSLKGAVASAERVQLFYSDGEVCGDNAKGLRDGVLQLLAGPLDTVSSDTKDGTEFAEKYLKKYQESGMDAFTYELANGMHAVGYPSGEGTSHYIEDDKEAFTKTYEYPASIWVIDDTNHVAYRLKAYMPLEDLVKIGGSLREETS